jgi:GNAT superfamily N-acetyltransferase
MSTTLATEPSRCHAAPNGRPVPRRLTPDDRGAVLDHLLRLDDADRRLRFMQASTDGLIAGYVARIDFSGSACFGCFDDAGELVALAEGLACEASAPRCVEAALSTDAGWRQCGLARLGFAALEAWCSGRGVERIVLHCDARNTAMRRLLHAMAAVTTVEDGEVDAVVRPSHALH